MSFSILGSVLFSQGSGTSSDNSEMQPGASSQPEQGSQPTADQAIGQELEGIRKVVKRYQAAALELSRKYEHELQQLKQLKDAEIASLNDQLNTYKNLDQAAKLAIQKLKSDKLGLENKNRRLCEQIGQYRNTDVELEMSRDQVAHLTEDYMRLRGEAEALRQNIDEHTMQREVMRTDETSVVAALDVLKWSLRQFALSKGKNVHIRRETACELLTRYVPADFYISTDDRNLLTAALQRKTIESISRSVEELCMTDQLRDTLLEASILHHTTILEKRLSSFVAQHDMRHQSLPRQLRQKIFSCVGEHSYTEVNNPFINHVVKTVLEDSERYRFVTDENRTVTMHGTIEKIVRNYLSIFHFHLNAQPGNVTIEWVNPGTPFDEGRMEVNDIDKMDIESAEKTVVMFCMFPIIEAKLRGVLYSKAQVILTTQKTLLSSKNQY